MLLVAMVLCFGALVSYYIVHTKPKLPKRKPKPVIPLVKVKKLAPENYRLVVNGYGTVKALRVGNIVPEVSGRVVYLSPKLIPGGTFKRGEVLVRLDKRDYETALYLAEAELEEAKRAFEEIKAQAIAAKEEWRNVLGHKEPPPPLVAKEPQLAAAKARIAAAEAKVAKAKLDLARTVIKAPFDGIVVESHLELGQFVAKGAVLAKVYDTHAVEIAVPLEVERLSFFDIPGFNAKKGSLVKVWLNIGEEKVYPGQVVRTAAQADEKTRLINVFVRVKRPLSQKPPLLPGLFVKVEIKGHLLKNVFLVPREALYFEEGNWYLWLVKDGVLKRKTVKVFLFQGDNAIIKEGLEPGDLLLLTRLSAPVSGMKVRVKP